MDAEKIINYLADEIKRLAIEKAVLQAENDDLRAQIKETDDGDRD